MSRASFRLSFEKIDLKSIFIPRFLKAVFCSFIISFFGEIVNKEV